MDPIPLMHIYAQSHCHDDAYIVANIEGLTLLRNAIDATIASKRTEMCIQFAGDGEGYRLYVVPVTKEGDWFDINVALPYTDESAAENRNHALYPFDIIGPDRYEELTKQMK